MRVGAFGVEAQSNVLYMWTIFERPRDYPQGFVMRRFAVAGDGPPQPTSVVVYSATLEQIRSYVPMGLVCVPRDEGDDPAIVETWF